MSDKALVKQDNSVQITEEMLDKYLFSSKTNLSKEDKIMFFEMSKLYNLNPFKKEIYAVPFNGKATFVVAYNTFIQRAEKSGFLDGWNCKSIKDNGKIIGASIIIYRKDMSHPVEWEVSMAEFSKPFGGWKTMPEFMIKKVAIGQGFRLAFPNELTGLYLQEEMEDASQHQAQVKKEIEPIIETKVEEVVVVDDNAISDNLQKAMDKVDISSTVKYYNNKVYINKKEYPLSNADQVKLKEYIETLKKSKVSVAEDTNEPDLPF